MTILMVLTLTAAAQGVSVQGKQQAQGVNALELLKADPRRSYGTDFPYSFDVPALTKAPKGYTPFYISHYSRHGSRYYWNDQLYQQLDTLMKTAHRRGQLTAEGEAFYERFMEAKDELKTGVSELTDLGWEQHQRIARTMYNSFPEVFRRGGNVLAISSLTGRCVLSMASFCEELTQCNPKIEIREQSSRFTLDGVVPGDRQNPLRQRFPRAHARWEQHRDLFQYKDDLGKRIVPRVFTSTDSLPGNMNRIGEDLINLYTSLPSIGHVGMMGRIVTDEELAARWESSNLGTYSWVFGPQYEQIPILKDILKKAEAVISGQSDRIADLRFGHDTNLGPLTVLMGLNGADRDPEDPNEVKDVYQNWQTGKASNMQLVFYRGKKGAEDVLVKCLLNGVEARLPMATDTFPYYTWTAFRDFYSERCKAVQ